MIWQGTRCLGERANWEIFDHPVQRIMVFWHKKEKQISLSIIQGWELRLFKVWVLDNESNKSAYSGGTGTYVGKSIFLGAGFLYQPKNDF
jgi:hypothetical protein